MTAGILVTIILMGGVVLITAMICFAFIVVRLELPKKKH